MDEYVDYHQDIARSSFADMLNDDERNHAYHEAIRKTVSLLVNSEEHNPSGNKQFKCCDIGTGSGLLSMMIVKSFDELNYDKFDVTAFEMFKPMAECASRIVEANGMSAKVKVVPTRVEDYNQPVEFDLVVAELLDTELIGEGCLLTYREVIKRFSSPTCIFIPQEARIYIEPIASQDLFNRQFFDDIVINLQDQQVVRKPIIVRLPEAVKHCSGLEELDDLQASKLGLNFKFTRFSEPKVIFHFRFSDLTTLKLEDESSINFEVYSSADEPPVVVMWWDIVMYDKSLHESDDGSTRETTSSNHDFSLLSCSPCWSREERMLERDKYVSQLYGRDVWREHWMQALYYFADVDIARNMRLEPKQTLRVYAKHDSHSLCFDLKPIRTKRACDCGVHRNLSRAELSFLNDSFTISKIVTSLLGHDSNSSYESRLVFAAQNDLHGVDYKWKMCFYGTKRETGDKFLFDYSFQDEVCWLKLFNHQLRQESIEPYVKFEIICSQVVLPNLSRIQSNIGHCQGFNLTPLDKLIKNSSKLSDSKIESHYLWQYDFELLSDNVVVLSSEEIASATSNYTKTIAIPSREIRAKQIGALVFWAKFYLDSMPPEVSFISSGLIQLCSSKSNLQSVDCIPQARLGWNPNFKQLVHFVDSELTIDSMTVCINPKGLTIVDHCEALS